MRTSLLLSNEVHHWVGRRSTGKFNSANAPSILRVTKSSSISSSRGDLNANILFSFPTLVGTELQLQYSPELGELGKA